jgi:hypothetical protein
LDQSLFIMAPGQSGDLASTDAWNMLKRWRDGATIRLGPRPDVIAWEMTLTP